MGGRERGCDVRSWWAVRLCRGVCGVVGDREAAALRCDAMRARAAATESANEVLRYREVHSITRVPAAGRHRC